MLIDWFTVGAQALNFLILVWLMKRFLYRPVLAALDAREKLVAAELADAAAKQAAALQERADLQRKNEDLDRQRAALLRTAAEEATAEGRRLLGAARQAADALTAKRGDALLAAAENLNEAISRRTQEEVFAIARQALNDLATTSLEEQLGEVFIRRLRELAPQAKADLAKALQATSEPVLVRSAFDLPAKSRQAIQEALNATFARDIAVRFATAPQVVSGIELSVSGQKVAWSLAEYLTALEKSVRELLLEGTHAAAAASAVTAPPRAAEPVLAAADR